MLNLPGVKANMIFHVTDSSNKQAPVRASAYYYTDDPYAITLSFDVGAKEPVEWIFARQLLIFGLKHHSGEGDVRVWPTQSPDGLKISINLSSPTGHALFETPAPALAEFLKATCALVPIGSESEFLNLQSEVDLFLSRKSWKGI